MKDQVPVIDISPLRTTGEEGKRGVARALAAACEETGFFSVVGHGVDEDLIARTRQAAADFFALPTDRKCRILRDASRTGRGYYPPADRALAKTLGEDTPPDLQEAWVMTPENLPDHPYYRGEVAAYFFGPNRWPNELPTFRDTSLRYFEAMSRLGQRVMSGLALTLDLDEGYFVDKFDKPTNQLRFIHYPPQETSPAPGQLRAGAHTDYGAVTLLRGDDVPGTLQVRLPRGGWTEVRPPPGAFVCNLGDAMARWTGWASTLHRVGNPPQGTAPQGRISLVFFHQPNYDTILGGIGAGSSELVTLGEHYIRKIHAAVDTTPPAA